MSLHCLKKASYSACSTHFSVYPWRWCCWLHWSIGWWYPRRNTYTSSTAVSDIYTRRSLSGCYISALYWARWYFCFYCCPQRCSRTWNPSGTIWIHCTTVLYHSLPLVWETTFRATRQTRSTDRSTS